MRRLTILFSLFAVAFSSCKENERLEYNTKAGLYFSGYTDKDSITYTFTMTAEDSDTVNIAVRLLGKPLSEDKTFNINVLPSTTAKEGMHYTPLASSYTLPKGRTSMNIPVYMLYDKTLDESIVELQFSIKENETFDVGYPGRNLIRLKITNQLICPSYWEDLLVMYFDEYSKVKHAKCIEIMGHDFPLMEPTDYQYYMKMGRSAAMYFAENPTLDENGILIAPWAPF